MSLLLAVAPALPLGKAGKFVAAAYIVFVLVILIYVAIMAVRAQRLEGELTELRRDVEAARRGADPAEDREPQESRAVSELLAIGVSHKTAPVEVRERLALPEAGRAEFMRELRGAADVHEAVAINTCNRTELYLVVGDPVEAESTVLAMLARQAGIRPTELATAIYSHRNCDAARHLYRVVSGLDSMIIGEAEIQGQVKRSYEAALATRERRPAHQPPVQGGAATGKRVRTETAIGERQLSLPGVAVALAREELGDARGPPRGDHRDRRDERAGRPRARRQRRPRGVRRHPPARSRAQPRPPLPRLERQLRRASRGPARRRHGRGRHGIAAPAARGRRARHRDGRARRAARCCSSTSPSRATSMRRAPTSHGVSLHDIDDLQAVAGRNRKVRQAEARKAEGIIEEEIQQFAAWLGSLEVLPTLAALRSHATAIAESVVSENDGKWESASPRDRERIDALARAVVNRLLHEPTLRMKEMRDDRVHARMALVRDLFGLSEEATLGVADAGAGEPSRAERLAEVRALRGSRRRA